MNFELKALTAAGAAREKCDLLLVLVSDQAALGSDAIGAMVAHAVKQGDFALSCGKQLALYQVPAIAARRVLLVGLGAGSAKDVRNALAGCAAALKSEGVEKAVVSFAAEADATSVTAAVQALGDATYAYTHTKSQAKPIALKKIVLGVQGKTAALSAAFDMGVAQQEGVAVAREWANRPANHATPTMLANAAKSIAKAARMSCKIHGPAEVAKLGMGAFMAVAQGSREPLRFIELHYNGGAKSEAPIVLVGKGITFDTGGISLKPAAEMDEMKFDMGGAASVLGVFQALAKLQPAINVVGLIPACENMPDGAAVKPGDVVTSMSGQTIEILNTDAEGRLVLCDALHYAARFKPTAMVDMATLTGACVIALGGLRSGLFSADGELAAALQSAGDTAMDPCWRMPLDDEYAEGLKSNFADMGNVAGRAAGAVTAAKFLQKFVGDIPWAHLDIAGTAWKSGAAKGATGRPVGLLLQFLLNKAGSAKVAKPTKAVKTAAPRAAAPRRAASKARTTKAAV
ncbi:leucyl aminopeptidase [Comamonas testosteroni]|uniref:Probable cytosol aminopeptidase n=1 Tax=Comamonas testosteroni TaxID=285 RepID=A0A373FCM6_COMTE|nr:leucyl aminopeptidase [Comamonas testosteroni]RGE41159.1 leucyl aminopeptidase [Comamonas testosteroni]